MVKRIKIMLQVKLGFTVKASSTVGNSTADLAKKNKGSVASITKVVSYKLIIIKMMMMTMLILPRRTRALWHQLQRWCRSC